MAVASSFTSGGVRTAEEGDQQKYWDMSKSFCQYLQEEMDPEMMNAVYPDVVQRTGVASGGGASLSFSFCERKPVC